MDGVDQQGAQFKELLGKLVADELRQQQSQDANFDPRGTQGEQIDDLTASIVKNLVEPGGGPGGPGSLEQAINSNKDMKYIVDRLMANPLIIPYVAAWLDDQLAEMTTKLESLFKETFPSQNPPDASAPPADS